MIYEEHEAWYYLPCGLFWSTAFPPSVPAGIYGPTVSHHVFQQLPYDLQKLSLPQLQSSQVHEVSVWWGDFSMAVAPAWQS